MKTRILQNQADGSPGNGAPATPAAVETPAQPAAPTPAAPTAPASVDTAAIAASVRDSLFAELRKAGVFEKNKPAPASGAKPNGEAPAVPQADPIKLRALDRALSRTGLAEKLTDAQYRRAERDFVVEDPSDADSWAKDYFNGFGGSAPAPSTPAAPAAQPAAPAQPSNAIPASSRGAPPAPQVPLEEMNPWTMSETDRDAFIKQKGIKVYLEKARQFGKQITIDTRK